MAGSVLASLIIAGFTARYFLSPRSERDNVLVKTLEQAFYVDQLLRDFIVIPFKNLSLILYETIDSRLLRGEFMPWSFKPSPSEEFFLPGRMEIFTPMLFILFWGWGFC